MTSHPLVIAGLNPADPREAREILEDYDKNCPFRTGFQQVQEFHDRFAIPCYRVPANLPEDVAQFRIKFLQEELDEYKKSVAEGDLAGALDALIDLVYVAFGTADMHGFSNFDAAFYLVHRANMLKERAKKASDSKRGSTYDVVKPHGWKPPAVHVAISLLTGEDVD